MGEYVRSVGITLYNVVSRRIREVTSVSGAEYVKMGSFSVEVADGALLATTFGPSNVCRQYPLQYL